jgi:hypothetical protein
VVTIDVHAVRFSQSKLYSTTSSESELKLNTTSQLVQLCQSCTVNVQLGFSVSIQDHVIVISFVCSSSSFTSIVQLSLPVYHSLGTYSIVSHSHVVQVPLFQLFTNPLNSTVPLPHAQSLTSESFFQFTQDHLQTFSIIILSFPEIGESVHIILALHDTVFHTLSSTSTSIVLFQAFQLHNE